MNHKNIEPEEFKELMGQEDYIVLDVRAPEELVEGAIDGHKLISMFDPSFRSQIENLDKSKKYLIYCRSGNRSGNACGLMSQLGFEHLYSLSGGIVAWNEFLTTV